MEENIVIDGHNITYMYRKGKLDCRHLLVILSGFGATSNFTYDFSGSSLDIVPSHILWIKDEFAGNCCYYICHHMDFYVEHIIMDFIDFFCKKYFFDRESVTILGASKGGSAALYFGLKYNFKSIISSAPQIKIGSFIQKIHHDIYCHMINQDKDKEVLDKLIMNAIINGDKKKNIYLFSSPVDEHETCDSIHDFLNKYKNFNHIVTNSTCVWRHNTITSYNVPLIVSIICANSQGAYPRFGEYIYNGKKEDEDYNREYIIAEQQEKKEGIAILKKCNILEGKIFPEGVSFIRGFSIPTYGTIKNTLIIKNKKTNKEYLYPIGIILNNQYSKTYFLDTYCNYNAAGFASLKREGIDLDIPCGVYSVFMLIEIGSIKVKVPVQLLADLKNGIVKNGICRIFLDNGNASIQIIPPISKNKPDIYQLKEYWNNNKVHYRGNFIKYGIELKDWSDVSFWLVFHSPNKDFIFEYGKNNCEELNDIFDGFGHYSKSNFCSIKNKGVDISQIQQGKYDVYISMLVKGSVFSQKIEEITINR